MKKKLNLGKVIREGKQRNPQLNENYDNLKMFIENEIKSIENKYLKNNNRFWGYHLQPAEAEKYRNKVKNFHEVLKKELQRIEGNETISANTLSSQKLNWNGQKNILIDVFYKLKRTYDKGKPLLPNSNEDIALFLKNNFACFNKTQLSTILLGLKKSERPLKDEKRVII